MRARYYDAHTGRFLTRDLMAGAVTDSQTLNAFSYGGNNPITRIDPKGLWFQETLQSLKYLPGSLLPAASCVIMGQQCNTNQSTTMNIIQGIGKASFDFLALYFGGGTALASVVSVAEGTSLVLLGAKDASAIKKITSGRLTEAEARELIAENVDEALDEVIDKEIPTVAKPAMPSIKQVAKDVLGPIIIDYILKELVPDRVTQQQSGPIQPRGPAPIQPRGPQIGPVQPRGPQTNQIGTPTCPKGH